MLRRGFLASVSVTTLALAMMAAPAIPLFGSNPLVAVAQAQRRSPTRAAPSGPTITLNQKRARIEQLIKKIGEATKRTILVPDDVRGSISIVTQRPVSHDEAWQILESSLSILGFSLLPSTVGNWRIAKVADAVGEAPFRPDSGVERDSFVTTLLSLRYAKLQDVLAVIQPLSGSRVTLVPYEATNSLIASGSERAIARLATLAAELDEIEEKTLRLRVLRYRGVDDVEPLVEGFLASGDLSLSRVQVWSDSRTNSLAIRGEEEGVARVIAFIEDLDRPAESAGSIRILRVLHRDPEEVAELIRTFADSSRAATSAAAASAGPLDGSDYSIAVDAPTRSLVVRADPQTHAAIRDVLEILDERPELIAVDITVSELRTPASQGFLFGFQLPFARGSGEGDLIGFFASAPEVGEVAAAPTITGRIQRDTGVSFTTEEGGLPISVPILQTGTISAIGFEASNEVLIQPSLVVTAGEEHEIFVGDNIPIPVADSDAADAGTTIGGVDLSTLSRTVRFDRQDVGTTLKVEALAGREGKIQLDLDIELTALDLSRAGIAGDPFEVGPSITKKNLIVKARLDDGESAILAVSNRKVVTKLDSGVPFLRDLPYLGFLFRAKGSTVDQIRLMIVARARRVSNPSQLVADTIRRRLALERRSARESGLPDIDGPPFGVRVTTRRLEDDADAIAESLSLRGHRTYVHRWRNDRVDYYDVYVTHLGSMSDAAEIARELYEEGWEADLVVLSKHG